ncbi:2-succinyl-5-enolpyruvyl-6-hydroxy-3-cyclohexene- 1-carboxylic-acid synthase [Microbacterium kribbense]|uniref:2-succinyl-5-enolpyruvyl-6-hydroxy-3-cyclohexene-1-carboxylate synthase n=1 Tax=Microbacterium kribbense TaxID=433645 RepID=A0ABP7GHH6_9MICO
MGTEPESAARAQPSPATDAAAALLAHLVGRGIRHVVLSPGSRSQALALVAAELERRGTIALHVRIDERVAGFVALGIGRETGMPAAVICTSGTATANLLPAVLEADHSGVPMVLLTADRPPELRGIGANQTTRQHGIYGDHVRWQRDLAVPTEVDDTGSSAQAAALCAVADEAMDAALGFARDGAPGPVHLNLPYREPLSGTLPAWLASAARRGSDVSSAAERGRAATELRRRAGDVAPRRARPRAEVVLDRGPRTIVIAGAGAGPGAEDLAYAGGWPLVAEIVSGARFGRHLVHGYRDLLREPELGGRVQRAVVFGHPTLSREVTALLQRSGIEVLAVRGPGEALNLNGATVPIDAATVADGPADRDWLGQWLRASRAHAVDVAPRAPDADGLSSAVPKVRLTALSAEVELMRTPLTRELLVDGVWRATWPHDRLVFGSSRLVRVADGILPGKKVPVHSNRGLAGIDGTIATAIGIAAASQADGGAGLTRVLLGDLALLHDIGALLLSAAEPDLRIQIIVGNDGGGTIFDGLEVGATADAAAIDRVLYTPHEVAIEQLAAGYGWEYQRATTRAELDQALTGTAGDRRIIEVPLPR